MGKLTTHVLDTMHGKPGVGIAIALFRREWQERRHLADFVTNEDGRCTESLLSGISLTVGVYELDFHIGDYFAALDAQLSEPRFLDIVTLRFGIADVAAHYHVPLLVSPYSYSTYRGS